MLFVSWLLLLPPVSRVLFPSLPSWDIAWAAIGGGTLGALFSVAIGISSRTLLLELRYRDNATDAGLRILIGAIGAAVLVSLQRAGVITGSLFGARPGQAVADDTIFFILGFIAGFSERLVPDMLAKINVGAAPSPVSTGAAAPRTAADAAVALGGPGSDARTDAPGKDPALVVPADKATSDSGGPVSNDSADDEDCLCDGLPADTVAQTGDVELPQAAGGVAPRP